MSRHWMILPVAGLVAFTIGRGVVAHVTEKPEPAGLGAIACVASVAVSVAACDSVSPLCPIAMTTVACNCVPLIIDEFSEMSCP